MGDVIKSKINTGADAVRGWDLAKCERVYKAALRVLGWSKTKHADMTSKARRWGHVSALVKLCNVTEPQAWASWILDEVRSAHTVTTHSAPSQESREWSASEGGHTIHDETTADRILRAVMGA